MTIVFREAKMKFGCCVGLATFLTPSTSEVLLKVVVLPGISGFIGKRLWGELVKSSKTIRTKLAEDLQYLKELDEKVLKSQGRTKAK